MTLKELAEISGVSVGTVSKAFADSREVSSATKAKIFAIAKENNCYEKYYLRNFSKRIVSIIVPSAKQYADVISVLEKAICSSGGFPVVLISNSNKKAENELIDFSVRYKKTDGAIIINPINKIDNELVMAIQLDSTDFISLLNEAIRLLKEVGHTKISFISSPSGNFSSGLFKETLAENGIRSGYNYYAESDNSTEMSGYEAMEYLFGMPNIPTAVVAETNSMAKGAEKCILKHGFRVPKDISVIGLDGLSSKNSSLAECKAAVNILFQRIEKLSKKRSKNSH